MLVAALRSSAVWRAGRGQLRQSTTQAWVSVSAGERSGQWPARVRLGHPRENRNSYFRALSSRPPSIGLGRQRSTNTRWAEGYVAAPIDNMLVSRPAAGHLISV